MPLKDGAGAKADVAGWLTFACLSLSAPAFAPLVGFGAIY